MSFEFPDLVCHRFLCLSSILYLPLQLYFTFTLLHLCLCLEFFDDRVSPVNLCSELINLQLLLLEYSVALEPFSAQKVKALLEAFCVI
jgi:hypothetical protein